MNTWRQEERKKKLLAYTYSLRKSATAQRSMGTCQLHPAWANSRREHAACAAQKKITDRLLGRGLLQQRKHLSSRFHDSLHQRRHRRRARQPRGSETMVSCSGWKGIMPRAKGAAVLAYHASRMSEGNCIERMISPLGSNCILMGCCQTGTTAPVATTWPRAALIDV